MATDNNIFGGNVGIDPNQRIAINNAQIQRNNAQINGLNSGMGYIPQGYGNNGYMSTGFIDQYQRPPQPQFLKCRPVTSIEEARAAQIDLDGSLWVFADIGHGKIYTKQMKNDGSSAFGVYTYIEEEAPTNNLNNFVTKDEMNNTIQAAVQYILNMFPKEQQEKPTDIKNEKATTSLTF